MRALLILRKDLRVLARSPLLLGTLLAYPLLVAGLVGLVAAHAGSKPRVGFVDRDGLPRALVIGGRRFDVDRTIAQVSGEVELVRLRPAEARRRLETGDVVATVTVPRGFVADLRASRSPRLVFEATSGGLAPRVRQQVQALVYSLNRQLSSAYVEDNLRYVRLILDGGTGTFFGRRFDVLGLRGTRELLAELPSGPRLDRIREFVRTAELALDQTDEALLATANPIELVEAPQLGRTWALSAQAQAYALALTLAFLALVLAAASLAAERDENVAARLLRGIVSPGSLVAAKVALAAVASAVLGSGIALAFGVAVELGDVRGGQPWGRLPVLALGLALAGASLGSLGALLGALAREARSASLAAMLVALPIVFLGLVPREAVPLAGTLSDAFPFAHAVRLFRSALYDPSPWGTLAVEGAWLAGLGLLLALPAGAAARRLAA